MDRRNLLAGLVVLASRLSGVGGSGLGTWDRKKCGSEGEGSCTVKSLPSFIAQGEFEYAATVGDVIEVSCDPYVYSAGAEVTLTASQLYSRCHDIYWYNPNENGELLESGGGASACTWTSTATRTWG